LSGKETAKKMRETLDKIFEGIIDHEKKQATTLYIANRAFGGLRK
jgi:hypothetical protein